MLGTASAFSAKVTSYFLPKFQSYFGQNLRYLVLEFKKRNGLRAFQLILLSHGAKKTHGLIMVNNGNSQTIFDTKLNLSYLMKPNFFVLIRSIYDGNFGQIMLEVTVNA